MSGGTSAGNIVTEAAGTYGVRTWLTTVKADALGVISDAQLDSIIGANWFNNADDNFTQLNLWFNGTGEAAHIRAAQATIGTVSFTDLEAESAMIGTGDLADAPTSADDVVIGNLAGTDRGLSILSTSVARLAFVDTAATLTGFLAYAHSSDTMTLGVAGASKLTLTSAELSPALDSGLSLGSGSKRLAEAHAFDVYVYDDLVVSDAATVTTSVSIGDGAGAPFLALDRDTLADGEIRLRAEGVTRWRLRHKADGDFAVDRLDGGGTLEDSVLFSAASGDVTLPAGLSVTGGGTFGSNLFLDSASPTLTIGDGNGTPYLVLDGPSVYILIKDGGVNQFQISNDGSLAVAHVSNGGLAVDSSGNVRVTGPGLVIGSAVAAAPYLQLSKDDAGTASFAFINESVTRWAWVVAGTGANLALQRYSAGGVLQETCTFSATTGSWSLPVNVTLTGSGRVLTVGDNTGNAAIYVSKTTGGTGTIEWYANAVKRWQMEQDSSQNFILRRYNSGGTLQDSMTVSNSDGSWSFPKSIGLSGSASRFSAGTGAPSGGSNGDLYWRTDGTASTCLYYRVGGVWTALAT